MVARVGPSPCCTSACTISAASKSRWRSFQACRHYQPTWIARVSLPLHSCSNSLAMGGRCSVDSTAELPALAINIWADNPGRPGYARHRVAVVAVHSSLSEVSSDLREGQEQIVADDTDRSSIDEWELDFCSRPIVDGRGKKVWELVVRDSKRQLQFTRFYPNNVINSVTLRDALSCILQTLEVPKPQKIRFFRSQMQTIISKACKELDIQPVPSQRCITLVRWLEERYETVYRQHPGFQEGSSPLFLQEQVLPLDLPDTLRGEEWAFVQLPLSGILEEMAAVKKGTIFGSVLGLDTLELSLSPDVMIPGVAVASCRATPPGSALELSSIEVDKQRACLVLSTGVTDRWRYAFYQRSRLADKEAEAWEEVKKKCGGLHFLAVQQSLDADCCTGFWLLMDVPRSPV